jgi:glycopeptide antibiotics resistance protein
MPDFLALPLFLPGLAAVALLGLVVCRWLAVRLGCSPLHAWILVVSLGIVLAATLTPLRAALDQGPTGPKPCDLSRIWFAPLEVYLRPGDIPGNVLMFIPLGLALGLLPASRARVPLILGALLLPVVVETTQLVATVLDRACQSGDVVDNLAGLVAGLLVGSVAAAIGSAVAAFRARRVRPDR